jgi:hypothetical protein
MPEDNKNLNPQIHETDIGIVNLRKIKIYPLAVGHQLEMSDLISEAVGAFVNMTSGDDEKEEIISFISFVIGLIRKNIGRIIKYLTKEDESILKEITNVQLSKIVGIVYRENFEIPSKNVMNLFQQEEVNQESPLSKKSVQRSARPITTP